MDARILRGNQPEHFIDNMSLGQYFFTMSKKHGDKIAQIDSKTGEKESFNSIRKRSVRAAIELAKQGITSNDIVVFCTVNSLDNVVPFIGASYLGAKIASLDPTLSLNHVQHLLNLVQPTMIFVEPKSLNLIEEAIKSLNNSPQIVIFGDSSKYPTLKDFTKAADNEDEFKPVEIDPNETAMLFFSSGTTGLPKAICLNSKSIIYLIVNTDFKPDGGLLHFTSLYWVSGIVMIVLSYYFGSYRVYIQQFDAEETFKVIDTYKVVLAFTSPLSVNKLISYKNASNYDTSSLRVLWVGGGPIGPKKLQKAREIFKYTRVTPCYGQTEVGYISFFNPEDYRRFADTKLTSCGKIAPGVTAKIIDPDTRKILPPYQKGEICCKSIGLMKGYYKMDASLVFDDDGYVRTGDIGYYDEDECLYVVDRIKEMFKYQSWHIVPSAIEIILLEHPAIVEACVYGIPHEEDGEVPAATVVIRVDAVVTPEEIVEFVAQKVSDNEKLRAGVIIVDSLPKTSSGKIARREVKDQGIHIRSKQ